MTARFAIALSALLVIWGCASRPAASSAASVELGPLSVPLEVVEKAKHRMPELRRGMSDEEVLLLLGLTPYRRQMIVQSGGSRSRWHNDYLLRGGCCLSLRSDGHGLV